MYFRVKRTGTYAYLQIVESFREKGQVHQRVLSTVGRLDALQATGQLDTLMRSGLRFCEKLAVIEEYTGAGSTAYCPRCKQALAKGQPSVRCPQCGILYHQLSEDLPCWTYSETCALCPQPTDMSAGYRWTPEEL